MLRAVPVNSRTERVTVGGGSFPDVEATVTTSAHPQLSLLIVPGWKSSGRRPLFNEMATKFAALGVATIQYDPAYCTDPNNLNLQRVHAELKALSDFVIGSLSSRVVLLGASLGAFAIGSFLVNEGVVKPAGIITRAGAPRSRKFGAPPSPKVFDALVRVACPLLLMHGDADETVPIEVSQELHDARRQKGLPSEFISLPGFGHVVKEEEISSIIGHTQQFLDRLMRT